jgi:hypothetical protein
VERLRELLAKGDWPSVEAAAGAFAETLLFSDVALVRVFAVLPITVLGLRCWGCSPRSWRLISRPPQESRKLRATTGTHGVWTGALPVGSRGRAGRGRPNLSIL